MFLMEVRDNEFPVCTFFFGAKCNLFRTLKQLLLRNSGGVTPLVHAMRLGNKDVAIILLGAFSRWVNHLEDNEIRKPQTQTYLKALRTLCHHKLFVVLKFLLHRDEFKACDR